MDLLVLKTLAQMGSLHGYGIVLHIQRVSDELLHVEEGSLYPALHRMEESGWINSEWALTETNRKAKYYKLTAGKGEQLSTMLVGIKPTDPATFVSMTALFFAISLLACYLPARRAAGLDPMTTLREQ